MARNLAQAADVSVFHHALVGVTEEMGEVLKRSAFSPNIKERQDYSCALFDAKGRLLAQAAHLPVHLGSMPASVRAVIDNVSFEKEGDFAIVNDPYEGGTHLPDITMVAPVYAGASSEVNRGTMVSRRDRRLIGYSANRAHHADIGGGAPGSMSPQTDLVAEGLVLPPVLFARGGSRLPDLIRVIRANTRTPDERTGDLNAQLFACDRGGQRLIDIERKAGATAFLRLSDALVRHSRALMLHSLKQLRAGVYRAEDVMDDDGAGATDIPIRVALTVSKSKLVFDFTGSAPQVRGGINAVLAVTQSACFYAALCFCKPVPPVNAGCFDLIQVVAPEGSVVNARRPAAVAGGNVETSQRIVDVCLSALGLASKGGGAAQSQGTMNNVTMGGSSARGQAFTYYETIAGGCGATPGQAGASATHSHMTNTLNTPIEALEHAYPLRVEEYSLRENPRVSGLKLRGGAGITRRIRALVPCEYGLLTERRVRAPQGLNGAADGECGHNRIVRQGGEVEDLPSKVSGHLNAGDALEIQTPTGGSA